MRVNEEVAKRAWASLLGTKIKGEGGWLNWNRGPGYEDFKLAVQTYLDAQGEHGLVSERTTPEQVAAQLRDAAQAFLRVEALLSDPALEVEEWAPRWLEASVAVICAREALHSVRPEQALRRLERPFDAHDPAGPDEEVPAK